MSFSSEYLYYADYFNGVVGRINIQTKFDETLASGLHRPIQVRYDESTNKLYFLEAGTDAEECKDGTLKVISISQAPAENYESKDYFWLVGAIIAVCAMGLATRLQQSARTIRRILTAIIIFGLSFTIYYPIAQRPAYASDSLQDSFYFEFAVVLLATFLFSALEKGLSWPFIFGNSLAWGLVFGYNFFFGYPYWLIILYLIVDGLFFGFLYVFLGTVGQSFIGWIRNRKISSQLRAHVPTNVPAPSTASRRSVLAKKIRCHKCGHAIPDTDEYCVYCGVRFKKRIF
jgi:hypothetical protein